MPVLLVKFIALACVLFSSVVAANQSDQPVRVVASFSILGDWVQELGGDKVDVTNLVGQDEDVHVYKATPKDMALLSKAELLVVNGLGLEGWMNRIVDASGYSGAMLVASKGIDIIAMQEDGHSDHGHDHQHSHDHHDHDDHSDAEGVADPHAWTSLRQAIYYVDNIFAELVKLRPESADYFLDRKVTYLKQLQQLDERATALFSDVADSSKNIVIPHNSFAYLAKDYGLSVYSLSGMSTKSDTSARRVADVVRKVRSLGITAIFNENIANTKLIEQLENETSVVIAGTLISGALSEDKAPSYIKMMEYNLDMLGNAMNASDSFDEKHAGGHDMHDEDHSDHDHGHDHDHDH